MITGTEILDRAAEHVTEETRSIRREREAFEAFRQAVGRGRTAHDDGTRMDRLLEAYRRTVMSTPDFEASYDESLSEHLETEFTPSLAKALRRDEPLTQRRKRDLLVATNAAVETRTQFLRSLEDERESIRTVRETVVDVEETLLELPSCSFPSLGFDGFLDVWETCERAVERCDRRSAERQRHLTDRRDVDVRTRADVHAFHEYLYGDLEAEFPVLSALAATRRRIERYRGGTYPSADWGRVSAGTDTVRADGSSD